MYKYISFLVFVLLLGCNQPPSHNEIKKMLIESLQINSGYPFEVYTFNPNKNCAQVYTGKFKGKITVLNENLPDEFSEITTPNVLIDGLRRNPGQYEGPYTEEEINVFFEELKFINPENEESKYDFKHLKVYLQKIGGVGSSGRMRLRIFNDSLRIFDGYFYDKWSNCKKKFNSINIPLKPNSSLYNFLK